MRTKRITVFASGSGTNFKVLHQATLRHEIPASITALVSDKPEAGAVSYARSNGIRVHLLSPSKVADYTVYTDSLEQILAGENPDLIVLAGYLKKIPDRIVERYPQKIVNIHPSLLPKYGGKGWHGLHVHRAVIENGDKESGCTVHYVSTIYDEGPVIAQKKVPVAPDDTPETLSKKVQKQEHILYPKVVRNLLIESQNS